MKDKNLLIIFTRNPELGSCKTRLAAKVGDQAALDIYKFLLEHTVSVTKELKVSKQVHYSVRVRENDLWDSSIYTKKQQHGKDLGARMQHAFEEGFKEGFKRIVLIGSDLFDVSQDDLAAGFEALDSTNFVIGPAEDGGYYLLGMRTLNKDIFQNMPWGSSQVFEKTIEQLPDNDVALLPERNDVDVFEDIKNIPAFQQFLGHLKDAHEKDVEHNVKFP